MSKVIYKNDSLIPNKQLEQMFMSICTDSQMQYFTKAAQSEDPTIRAGASAYASRVVYKTFMYWRDAFVKQGGDLEYLQFKLFERDKNK